MKRPAGITIIAILALAVGIVDLPQGLRILGYVVFGPAQAFSNTSLTGWQFGDTFFAMIIPLIMLFYLNSEKVKTAFGMEG